MWTLGKQDTTTLKALEMRGYRKMLKMKYVRNEEVLFYVNDTRSITR